MMAKQKYISSTATKLILSRIDVLKIVEENPDAINLKGLTYSEKILLLNTFSSLKDYISIDKLTVSEKYDVHVHIDDATIADKYPFTSQELAKLPSYRYAVLLEKNLKKYYDATVYAKLAGRYKIDLYLSDPAGYLNLGLPMPKLTSNLVTGLVTRYPKLVDTHIPDLTDVVTTDTFWRIMLKQNFPKYSALFLTHLNSVSTKTDVRVIFWENPSLITNVTVEHIQNSKLTAKEWSLMIRQMKTYKDVLKNWQMSAELKDEIKYSLSVEILDGTSTMSTYVKNSLKDDIDPDSDEE